MSLALIIIIAIGRMVGGRRSLTSHTKIALDEADHIPGKHLSKKHVKFDNVVNQCEFTVSRQRSRSNVISTSIWKAKAGYLHAFEAAVGAWPRFLRESYGDEWNIRLYVDRTLWDRVKPETFYHAYDVFGQRVTQLRPGNENVGNDSGNTSDSGTDRDQLGVEWKDWSHLRDAIEHQLLTQENFELWVASCPTIAQAGTIKDTGALHRRGRSAARFGTTMASLLRFHPLFDPDVNIMLSRNFELLTSRRDAMHTSAWLESGKKFQFYNYLRPPIFLYPGSYHLNMSRWQDALEKSGPDSVQVAAALGPMWNVGNQDNLSFAAFETPFPLKSAARVNILASFFGVRGGLPSFMWDLMLESARLTQYNAIQRKGATVLESTFGSYGVDEIALTLAMKYIPLGFQEYKRIERDAGRQPLSDDGFLKALLLPVGSFLRTGGERLPEISEATMLANPMTNELGSALAFAQAPEGGTFVNSFKEDIESNAEGKNFSDPIVYQTQWLLRTEEWYASDSFQQFINRSITKEWAALGKNITDGISEWEARGCHPKTDETSLTLEAVESQLGYHPYGGIELVAQLHSLCRPLQLHVLRMLEEMTCPAPSECEMLKKYRLMISKWSTQPFITSVFATIQEPFSLWKFLDMAANKEFLGVRTTEEIDAKLWMHAILKEFVMWSVDAPGFTTKTKSGFMDRKRSYELYLEVSMAKERSPCSCQ